MRCVLLLHPNKHAEIEDQKVEAIFSKSYSWDVGELRFEQRCCVRQVRAGGPGTSIVNFRSKH